MLFWYGIGLDAFGCICMRFNCQMVNSFRILLNLVQTISWTLAEKDILILGKGPTDILDDTSLTRESEYSVSPTKSWKKLSLHCNGSSSFCYVIGEKFINSKQKAPSKAYPLSLGNISKYFTVSYMKELG